MRQEIAPEVKAEVLKRLGNIEPLVLRMLGRDPSSTAAVLQRLDNIEDLALRALDRDPTLKAAGSERFGNVAGLAARVQDLPPEARAEVLKRCRNIEGMVYRVMSEGNSRGTRRVPRRRREREPGVDAVDYQGDLHTVPHREPDIV